MLHARALLVAVATVAALGACGQARSPTAPSTSGAATPSAGPLPVIETVEALQDALDGGCAWQVTPPENTSDPEGQYGLRCPERGVWASWTKPGIEVRTLEQARQMESLGDYLCDELSMCESMVWGGNWYASTEDPELAKTIAARTGGYFMVSVTASPRPNRCEEGYSGEVQVFVTVSADWVTVQPDRVPAGLVVLCWRTEAAGRGVLAWSPVAAQADLDGVLGGSLVRGSTLASDPTFENWAMSVATFDADHGPFAAGPGFELAAGRYLFIGQQQVTADPGGVEDVVGHTALLTLAP